MKNSRSPRLSDLIRQPAPSRAPAPPAQAESSVPPSAPDSEPRHEPDETVRPDSSPAEPAPPDEPDASKSAKPLPIELSEPEVEARRDYDLLCQWLENLFASAGRGALECEDLFESVRAVLDRPNLLDALFAETFRTRRSGTKLAPKSLNVAIYALRLGRAIGIEGATLEELGAAALLHKIGFVRIPKGLVEKPGALGRRDLAVLHEHPRYARELIHALGPRFGRVADIVYQSHERCDGSGYPEGLREKDILREAQLIGLVDVFEALIQPRTYRQRLIPFAAVKMLLQRERGRFPRALLREFIASFSVFPPFTYVRLNSRAVARVEETEPGFPLRPKVTIVLDPTGLRPSRPQTVRLRESPLLYITGPVNEEELPA